MVVGQLLALALSAADYLSAGIFKKLNVPKMNFISLSAGVSIAYIFLILLPEIYIWAGIVDKILFLSILFGFSVFHLIEKHIRQKYHGSSLRKEDHYLHTTIHSIYFFIVGFILVQFLEKGVLGTVLLFVPLLLHTIISPTPKGSKKHWSQHLMLSATCFVGAIVATIVNTTLFLEVALHGFVGGVLLYIIIREALPVERKGKPMYFVTGVLFFTLVIFILGGFN